MKTLKHEAKTELNIGNLYRATVWSRFPSMQGAWSFDRKILTNVAKGLGKDSNVLPATVIEAFMAFPEVGAVAVTDGNRYVKSCRAEEV